MVTGSHTYSNVTDVFQAFQATVTIDTPTGSSAVVADFVNMTVPVLTDPPLAVRRPRARLHGSGRHDPHHGSASHGRRLHRDDRLGRRPEIQRNAPTRGRRNLRGLRVACLRKPGDVPDLDQLADDQGNTVTDSTTATVSVAPVSGPGVHNRRPGDPQQAEPVSQIPVTFRARSMRPKPSK